LVYPRRRLAARCMGRQRTSAGAFIGGLIAGGLAAGGAALLFAPKAGNVTRRFVRWKSARYVRNARERFSRSKVAR
jgi:gas vesicle protein